MKARMVAKEDDGAIPATPLVVVVCIAAGFESSETKLRKKVTFAPVADGVQNRSRQLRVT